MIKSENTLKHGNPSPLQYHPPQPQISPLKYPPATPGSFIHGKANLAYPSLLLIVHGKAISPKPKLLLICHAKAILPLSKPSFSSYPSLLLICHRKAILPQTKSATHHPWQGNSPPIQAFYSYPMARQFSPKANQIYSLQGNSPLSYLPWQGNSPLSKPSTLAREFSPKPNQIYLSSMAHGKAILPQTTPTLFIIHGKASLLLICNGKAILLLSKPSTHLPWQGNSPPIQAFHSSSMARQFSPYPRLLLICHGKALLALSELSTHYPRQGNSSRMQGSYQTTPNLLIIHDEASLLLICHGNAILFLSKPSTHLSDKAIPPIKASTHLPWQDNSPHIQAFYSSSMARHFITQSKPTLIMIHGKPPAYLPWQGNSPLLLICHGKTILPISKPSTPHPWQGIFSPKPNQLPFFASFMARQFSPPRLLLIIHDKAVLFQSEPNIESTHHPSPKPNLI